MMFAMQTWLCCRHTQTEMSASRVYIYIRVGCQFQRRCNQLSDKTTVIMITNKHKRAFKSIRYETERDDLYIRRKKNICFMFMFLCLAAFFIWIEQNSIIQNGIFLCVDKCYKFRKKGLGKTLLNKHFFLFYSIEFLQNEISRFHIAWKR